MTMKHIRILTAYREKFCKDKKAQAEFFQMESFFYDIMCYETSDGNFRIDLDTRHNDDEPLGRLAVTAEYLSIKLKKEFDMPTMKVTFF